MTILSNLNLLNPNINVGKLKYGFYGLKINSQNGHHFYAKCGYQHIPSEVYLFSNIKYTVYKRKHHITYISSPLNQFIEKRHKINIRNGRHFDAISMLNEVINKTPPAR